MVRAQQYSVRLMIITGAFLTEGVIENDGKFYVWGGGVTSWDRAPGVTVYIPLVLLLQAEPGDTTEVVSGELFGPDGSSVALQFAVHPEARKATAAGWMGTQIILPPSNPDGRYIVIIGDVSLPIQLTTKP